jgi:hypothetical protein
MSLTMVLLTSLDELLSLKLVPVEELNPCSLR